MDRLIRHIQSCRHTIEMHKKDNDLIPSIPINCILTEEEAKNYPTATKDRKISFKNFSNDIKAIPTPEQFWFTKSTVPTPGPIPDGVYKYIIYESKIEKFFNFLPKL